MGSSRTSTFIAVYRGRTASDARLVAVSSDPVIVATVVGQMLADRSGRPGQDPVVGAIDRARREGLRLIRRELREPPGSLHDRGQRPWPR
jgi:hypothetical protein